VLTDIFYYISYKPYIFKTVESGEQPARPKREKIADMRHNAQNFKVLLSKSLRPDVVDYVRGITYSVVGIKESTKYIVRDMTDFNKNLHRRGVDTAKRWIKCDLEEFVESYNTSTQCLCEQKHSQALRQFSESLKHSASINLERLALLGIYLEKDGKLIFDEEKFNGLDEWRLSVAIGETLSLFKNIYSESSEILGEPLKEHMDFRGHGYYYNYKLGRIENDTFKIIESGMIVDRAV